MQKMKKISALFLAILMTFNFAVVPAYAADILDTIITFSFSFSNNDDAFSELTGDVSAGTEFWVNVDLSGIPTSSETASICSADIFVSYDSSAVSAEDCLYMVSADGTFNLEKAPNTVQFIWASLTGAKWGSPRAKLQESGTFVSILCKAKRDIAQDELSGLFAVLDGIVDEDKTLYTDLSNGDADAGNPYFHIAGVKRTLEENPSPYLVYTTFTVTWLNEDGAELEKDEDVEYGATPSYDGAEPSKEADAQYTYTFDGWDQELAAVTQDATYTAVYKETVNTYTVTWVNDDDSVLKIEVLEYGATPEYADTPSKEADAENTYAFLGWEPAVAAVTEDVTYKATYTSTTNAYTVTWVNEDGTVLKTDTVDYGQTPAYDGDTPVKEADAQYTYTFQGWEPDVDTVTGDVTYTATYTSTLNAYTVTWLNDDESVLRTDTVDYGATPDYGGEPSKDADEQYTYAFLGWSPAVAEVTGDATYTATYTSTTNAYTVTWVNEDGTVLKTDTVDYGQTPAYDGDTPVKAADAQYTYTFQGWEPDVDAVTGDVTYTATYTSTVNTYMVIWLNDDGETVLKTDEAVPYGETPDYGGEPSKEATDAETYTFLGWSPAVVAVTGNAIYKATYTSTTNAYTVTWVNEDGTVLETDTVEYGQTPSYDGDTPVKEADAENTYAFRGWDPAVVSVTGDATYQATYASTTNTYTVIWNNDDGTELERDENVAYGETPSYDGDTPVKAADAQYTYTFKDWEPTVDTVTGDVTYTATYTSTVNTYTVIWLNEDGESVLKTDEGVPYGAMPDYGGEPSKAADAENTYVFLGWSPAVVAVTGNAFYKATYTSTTNAYTVTWVNDDGTVLETDENIPYGATPEYNGDEPSKAADAQYTYTFKDWEPTVDAVTGDVIYTAVYEATVNAYTVTWADEDGTVLKTDSVDYGVTPSYDGDEPFKAADAQYTYAFQGWSPAVDAVTGDVIYTAVYEATVNTYTVTWLDEDGAELEVDEGVPYGQTPTYDGDTPYKEATAAETYSFRGWDPTVAAVEGDATYTAVYVATTNVYTVTWKNDNGDVLYTDDNAVYGVTPVYTGATPVKAEDAQYTYAFSGWEPEPADVMGDATYTAKFDGELKSYDVTWLDEDGTELATVIVPYGDLPVYDGPSPVKAATDENTYTFSGWEPEVAPVTGKATYRATFSSSVNVYTVTWIDGNGVELKTDSVEYGLLPDYVGATPLKDEDEQYTYEFSGQWDPEPAPVMGNATYTAKFDGQIKSYLITWLGDEELVLQETPVPYGSMPVYDGETPVKTGDDEFSYEFSGWTPDVVAVTGEATYQAVFDSEINTYAVTWMTADGEILEMDDNVAYGETPSYDGSTPLKDEDEQYTYSFSGWDPEPAAVMGNATYVARFDGELKSYLITWVDDDDTVLQETTVEYGSMPVYDGATPVKAADDANTYAFSGWTPDVVAVTGEAIYKASFSSTLNSYTVTWQNEDGTVLKTDSVEYGVTPEYDGAEPSKAEDAQYAYRFSGWTPDVAPVMGNVSYTARFDGDLKSYAVTWKNEDGATLELDESVPYGSMPVYNGPTPAKASDFRYDYTFSGWSPNPAEVTGNVTYTAAFASSLIDKAAIAPEVSIADWTYGDTAKTPELSGNPGNGDVTYDYAPQGSSAYAGTPPVNAGSYTVRATVAESALYQSGVATADFTVYKAIQTAPREDEGYSVVSYASGKATVAVETGYEVCDENGPLSAQNATLSLRADTPYYVRKVETENYKQSPFTLFSVESRVTVELSADPAGTGILAGSGVFERGAEVSVTASPLSGYAFSGWYVGGEKVSDENPYAFTVNDNIRLTAAFQSAAVKIAVAPTVAVEFTYDGAEKNAILTEGQNCAVHPNSVAAATDAGSYAVIVLPETGYFWSDGSAAAKTFSWTIRKAARNRPDVQADPTGAYAITGVDASMEYRPAAESAFRPVETLNENGSLTADVGVWYVRYAETENYEASPATVVVIDKATPTVKIIAPSVLTMTSATVVGVVSPTQDSNGASIVEQVGFYYWPSGAGVVIAGEVEATLEPGSSEFEATLTNLTPNTEYFCQAFAVSDGVRVLGSSVILHTAVDASVTPVGSIQIEVYSELNAPRDVIVSIEEGNVVRATQSGMVSTNVPFMPQTFTDLPDGQYNVVVRTTDGKYTETRMVSITNGESQKAIFTVLAGRLATEVKIPGLNAPRAAVNGLSNLLTARDVQEAADDNVEVSISLNVTREPDASYVEGNPQIHRLLSTAQKVDFLLDLTLTKTTTELSEDGADVEVSTEDLGDRNTSVLEIAIPYANTSRTGLTMARYHNGVAQLLSKLTRRPTGRFQDGTFFIANGYIFLYASRFSTYAIVYTQAASPSNGGTVVSGGGGSGSSSSSGGGGGGGGGGSSAPSYKITVETPENGALSANRTSAIRGATITVTVTPDDDFALEALFVRDANDNSVTLKEKDADSYQFTMPSSDVTVSAVFKSTDDGQSPELLDGGDSGDSDDGTSVNAGDSADSGDSATDSGASPTPTETVFPESVSACPKDDSCALSAFNDLVPTAWYHDGVHYVLDNGMMTGYSDDTFRPNVSTTRAMIVTMLWRLEGEPAVEEEMNFADVEAGKWHTEAIRWAFANGIVNGFSDTRFGPQEVITRQQLVTILWRYAQYKGVDVSSGVSLDAFADADKVSPFAKDALEWAVGKGIVQGRSDNTIDPYGNGTRAQSATILARFCVSVLNMG